MARISIDSISNIDGITTISWSHDIKKVSLFNIVFDNNGSCQTIGVDGKSVSTSTDLIQRGLKYSVKIMALIGSTWVSSDYKIIEL